MADGHYDVMYFQKKRHLAPERTSNCSVAFFFKELTIGFSFLQISRVKNPTSALSSLLFLVSVVFQLRFLVRVNYVYHLVIRSLLPTAWRHEKQKRGHDDTAPAHVIRTIEVSLFSLSSRRSQ
jgi:hypothetical protein